ncbi:7110_t:CDS:2, partial [Cetraspora pellucida]
GLKPRCITRDLSWGTPVPLKEMKGKVFYVWFDAPIGKMVEESGPGQIIPIYGERQCSFPYCYVSLFINGYGRRMDSVASYKHDCFPNIAILGYLVTMNDIGMPVSVWIYYLISSRPETSDSIFTWKEFITRNNTELLANLGKFVNRVMKFVTASSFSSLYNIKLRASLEIAMEISRKGNGYLQESKLDNTLFANSPKKCASVIGVSINLIYLLSAVFSPYMPSVTESVARQLNALLRNIPDTFTMNIEAGH